MYVSTASRAQDAVRIGGSGHARGHLLDKGIAPWKGKKLRRANTISTPATCDQEARHSGAYYDPLSSSRGSRPPAHAMGGSGLFCHLFSHVCGPRANQPQYSKTGPAVTSKHVPIFGNSVPCADSRSDLHLLKFSSPRFQISKRAHEVTLPRPECLRLPVKSS